jgi:hypothetical protein
VALDSPLPQWLGTHTRDPGIDEVIMSSHAINGDREAAIRAMAGAARIPVRRLHIESS